MDTFVSVVRTKLDWVYEYAYLMDRAEAATDYTKVVIVSGNKTPKHRRPCDHVFYDKISLTQHLIIFSTYMCLIKNDITGTTHSTKGILGLWGGNTIPWASSLPADHHLGKGLQFALPALRCDWGFVGVICTAACRSFVWLLRIRNGSYLGHVYGPNRASRAWLAQDGRSTRMTIH